MVAHTSVIVVISFLLGLAGAWFVSRYAFRVGLVDIPNSRSSHNQPTPRGGGIGVLAALGVSVILMQLPLSFWLPASLLSLVNIFDDRLGLSAKTRLIFQFAAALAVILLGTPLFGPHASQVSLSILLLCVFIVGTANFYNFMDGINGIAGITGAVGFGLMAVFCHFQGSDHALLVFATCLSTACLGFLPLNVPRARVFMGDVGSILLGFTFAIMCVALARSAVDFLVLCGLLSTFYADALTTLYIRKRDGERLSQAHRRHLYQLLANRMQIPHWKISLGYGAVQAGVGTMLLFLRSAGVEVVAACEVVLFCCWWLVSQHMRRKCEDTVCVERHANVVIIPLQQARCERTTAKG